MSACRKALNESAASPLNLQGSRVTTDSGTSGETFRTMSSDSLPALTPEQQKLRRELRAHLRRQRRALTPGQRKQASRALARRLSRLPGMARARDVAAYIACDGEIDPGPFLARLLRRRVRVWLPVLARRPGADDIGMHFARMPRAGSRAGWQRNRFGIREPRNRTRRVAWKIDMLLIPLVGFDAHGQRLGMGGGFYDRLLAQLDQRPCRPRLIGLAHGMQRVDSLPVAAWDRPVDAVVTASRTIRAG